MLYILKSRTQMFLPICPRVNKTLKLTILGSSWVS